MKISGIYKITSPNGKIYIGQSIDVYLRFKYYKYLKCKSQKKLYNSLIKHGVENHLFEVIEQCSVNLLNERERYYQDFYNCVERGLNCSYTKTNDKTGKHSKETIDNIKKSLVGIVKNKPMPMKESTKNLISKSNIERFKNKENHPRYKVKLSDETKLKISNTKKEKGQKYLFGKEHQNAKLVLDFVNGIYYESVKEVSLLYNINYATLKSKLNTNLRIKNNTNFIYV
jgi:group I intron endonuclease